MSISKTYLDILEKYWGYTSFRGKQEAIIESIGQGDDTLGLMPTGGGKSITFQVPALAQPGICLVITPLIALMKDQVQNLRRRGIKATAIYSGMSRQEIIIALDNCIFGDYKFLYVSPERLETELFLQKLKSLNVSIITVDESHCISQWGYDFRPAYLNITQIRNYLPNTPVLALTATATPTVVKDIQQQLSFPKENVISMSFARENLAYRVLPTENKEDSLHKLVENFQGSFIVYTRNRGKTKEIAQFLTRIGIPSTFYHAGLSNEVKDKRQKEWQEEKIQCIVATNAFGMGIDKSNVRLVIHIDIPDSIEAYFQEAGRAGRDGKSAQSIILYAKSDNIQLKKRVTDNFPDREYIKTVYEKLQYYFQMAMGDGQGCKLEFDIADFCKKFKFFPVPVDSALRILSLAGYIEYTDTQDNTSRLLFKIHRESLYHHLNSDTQTDLIIQTLLRSYTGIFTDYAYINESLLASRCGCTQSQVYQTLKILAQKGIVHYIPRKNTPYIIYSKARVDTKYIHIDKKIYDDRKERYEERINAMLNYLQSTQTCRSRLLLNYFGEKRTEECKRCDICLKRGGSKELNRERLIDQIKEVLKNGPQPLPHILATLKEYNQELVVQNIRNLTQEGILKENLGDISLV